MSDHIPDELLSADYDGETTPEERALVERLLAESPEAERTLEELREVSATLVAASLPAPAGFREAVLRRIERESLLADAEPSQDESVDPGNPQPEPPPMEASSAAPPSLPKPAAEPAGTTTRSGWLVAAAALATTAAVLMLTVHVFEDPAERSPTLADGSPGPAGGVSDHLESAVVEATRPVGMSLEEPEGRLGELAERDQIVADVTRRAEANRRAFVPPPPGPVTDAEPAKKFDDVAESKDPLVDSLAVAPDDRRERLAKEPAEGEESLGLRTLAADSKLRFDETLRDAEVGDVVRALEARGEEVAVVRLTVVDRRQGLAALQLLLQRHDVTPEPAIGFERASRSDSPMPDDADAAPLPNVGDERLARGNALPAGADDESLEAVFVQATPVQLAATLSELRHVATFRELTVERPVALAGLEAYSRTAGNAAAERILQRARTEARLELADAGFAGRADPPQWADKDGFRSAVESRGKQRFANDPPSPADPTKPSDRSAAGEAAKEFEKSRAPSLATPAKSEGEPRDLDPRPQAPAVASAVAPDPAAAASGDGSPPTAARPSVSEPQPAGESASPTLGDAALARKTARSALELERGGASPGDGEPQPAQVDALAAAGANPLREAERLKRPSTSRQLAILVPSMLGRVREEAATPGENAEEQANAGTSAAEKFRELDGPRVADAPGRPASEGGADGRSSETRVARGASRASVPPLERDEYRRGDRVTVLFVLVTEPPTTGSGESSPADVAPAASDDEGGGA